MSRPVPPFLRPSFVSTRGDRVHLSHALVGGPAHESTTLCVGAAYELGRQLVDHAEGLLAGMPRPWDGEPGRTPFASRGSGRGGAPAPPRSGASPADQRAPTAAAARMRPTRPVDSGA